MKFLAYFDYLGYADFIDRNSHEEQLFVVNNNHRDIENALAKGKKMASPAGGLMPDLSESKVNCIVFSDTILFWVDEVAPNSLHELLEVCYRYHWSCIDYFFPVRGAIVFGEFQEYKVNHTSNNGATYGVNSIFGKGLVHAYRKAESQDWAGTIIDASVISFLTDNHIDTKEFLTPFAKQYQVPYKNGYIHPNTEWVLNLVKTNAPLNEDVFINRSRDITENFAKYNKRVENESVQRKIKNTINFLASYR